MRPAMPTLPPNCDSSGFSSGALSRGLSPTSATTNGATTTTPNGYSNPSCASALNPLDVWFKFTTPATGGASTALVVGTESMTRNPIAAFDHRTGFKLGAPVGFKDYMWEALKDPAAGINMIQTAENLAKKYGISRERVRQIECQATSRLRKMFARSRIVKSPAKRPHFGSRLGARADSSH